MPYCMQLILPLVFIISLLLLYFVLLFLREWRKISRNALKEVVRESIGHIGISVVVEYPTTSAPLLAVLEEEYSRSEVVAIVDLQRQRTTFGEVLQRYYLVQVDHSKMAGIRALYRSRKRVFRRVVVVDLPLEQKRLASQVASDVASFDYLLCLSGESVVARGAVTYCANIIASQHLTTNVEMRTMIGEQAWLERGGCLGGDDRVQLVADRVLAWRTGRAWVASIAILLPALWAFVAAIVGEWLLLATVAVFVATIVVLMYVSCHIMTEKSLFVTLDTIIRDFYRFLVEKMKNNYYLYKEGDTQRESFASATVAAPSAKGENNRKQL